jgi:hypothetical protein
VHESYFKRRFGSPLDYILGPHPRIILAMALLALFGLWMRHNAGLEVNKEGQAEKQLVGRKDAADLVKDKVIKVAELPRYYETKKTEPLRVSFLPIPDEIEDIAGSYNGGVAGVLQLVSAFYLGKRLCIAVLAAAAFILNGQRLPIPIVQGSPWIAAGIGVAMGLLGIVFFRRTAADS